MDVQRDEIDKNVIENIGNYWNSFRNCLIWKYWTLEKDGKYLSCWGIEKCWKKHMLFLALWKFLVNPWVWIKRGNWWNFLKNIMILDWVEKEEIEYVIVTLMLKLLKI